MASMSTDLCASIVVLAGIVTATWAVDADDVWISKVRKTHPRLFFDSETWPTVRARALGPAKPYFDALKRRVDRYPAEPTGDSGGSAYQRDEAVGGKTYKMPIAKAAKEWGKQAAETAFVYLATGERKYLEKTKKMLTVSVDVYHQCYRDRRAVNWYSTTRVCALAAYDWIYNDLTPDERRAFIVPMLAHVDEVQPGRGKPAIHRRNSGTSATDGFYGVANIVWFAGLAAQGDGFCDEVALKLLKKGYAYNQKLFSYRRKCAGDDGGLASATPGYAMGAYPWSQFNFLYTWRSATGEALAPLWPHLAHFPVWVMWNWIPSETGKALEFGTGDCMHYDSALPVGSMYTHLSQIMDFYGQSHPECAALASHVRTRCPNKRLTTSWPMYPFLIADTGEAPAGSDPSNTKLYARHFESLGQIVMRSGWTPDDTYCLFTCGSQVPSHKQYDENSFIIYKKGFLALDSGTRGIQKNFNLRHYYAQTVAHNCVLIHLPDEPLPRYWGAKFDGPEGKTNYGGMDKTVGAKVVAFETNEHYTYVAGDATACYSNKKCKLALRQLVFVMTDYFVICDRVISAKPEHQKAWLLHTQNEPRVDGSQLRADEHKGRLFCQTLYPKDAVLAKIGGPGKEFWANGKNWELHDAVKKKDAQQRKKTGRGMLWGNWRVEVKPGAPRAEDVFLHLIQVGDQTLEAPAHAQLLEQDGQVGVRLDAGGKSVRVAFGASGSPSGHVRIAAGKDSLVDRDFTEDVMPQAGLGAPIR